MGARGYWDRMLVYFGIAGSVYEDDERGSAPPARSRRRTTSPLDDDPAPAPRSTSRQRPPTRRPSQHVAGVGVVPPRTFNDAQVIADQFKAGAPVIVNLQATDADLAKRLLDFASGLTYGLDGSIGRIADKVFLLTPPDVSVSSEDRAEMLESGFFNQS